MLLQSGVHLEVAEMQDMVYSDEKWVRFILNQLISNAVKYRKENPIFHIYACRQQNQIILVVEDNGRIVRIIPVSQTTSLSGIL